MRTLITDINGRRRNDEEISVASATTTNLQLSPSENIYITGTTAIESFGTAPAGMVRRLRFADALTLTYNVTSMILPGAANIITAAGDNAIFLSLGSGNWVCTNYEGTTAIVTIASGSLAGNNVSITNIPQIYSSLILQVLAGSINANSTNVLVQLSTDNGSNYDTTAGNYSGVAIDETGAVTLNGNASALLIPTVGISAAETLVFTTTISGYQAGPYAQLLTRWNDTDGATPKTYFSQGAYLSASGINAIQIDLSAALAEFDAGTYALYGVR